MKTAHPCPRCGCVGLLREYMYNTDRFLLRCEDCGWAKLEAPKKSRRWEV